MGECDSPLFSKRTVVKLSGEEVLAIGSAFLDPVSIFDPVGRVPRTLQWGPGPRGNISQSTINI